MSYTAEEFRQVAEIYDGGAEAPAFRICAAALRIAAKVAEAFSTEVIDGLIVSHDPVLNLDGALDDLKRDPNADKVCLRTIERVQAQLVSIREALTHPQVAS